MSLGYKILSSFEPFWHCFFSEVSSEVLAVFICDLLRAASIVASSSKVTLAFGISCPYSKFLRCSDKIILGPFLAGYKKADIRVENSPILARLTEVLNPFVKLEQGLRKGLNLFCDSLVDCFFFFFSPLLAFHRTESHAKFSGK